MVKKAKALTMCIALLLLVGVTNNVYAQNRFEISGVVVDASDQISLPGVSVLVKGTSRGTATDLDGNFTLSVSTGETLVFSYIGYLTQEVVVQNQDDLVVEMQSQYIEGTELVVVGYGQQRRADVTGAISTITNEKIEDAHVINFGEAIQGLVPGVKVSTTGAPGAEPSIEIRGIGNFANNDPLYVIDGVPTRANRDFNVNDIESVQILKDASAAAIYGSRAANGVIIITTKKGKSGPLQVDFNSTVGWDWLPRFDLMGREEWIEFNNRAYDEAGIPRQNHADGDTNWQDEVFKVGTRQDQNLSISGGGENSKFLVSLNYLTNSGTTIGSDSERLSLRVNTEGKKGIFTIGENLAISNFHVNELNTNPIVDVTRMLPTIPVYNENNPGGFGYGDEATSRTFGTNPIAKEFLEDGVTENQRIRGNLFVEADLLKNLTYKFNYGYNFNNHNYRFLRKVGNFTLNQPYDPSRLFEEKGNDMMSLYENTLSYNQKVGGLTADVVLGQAYQVDTIERIWGEGQNLTQIGDDYYDVLDQTGDNYRVGGWKGETALLSYFGRANLNWEDKYIVQLTMRYDATSRLPKANRGGYFPSVSGAWRISKESFFDVDWITDLKLIASYGQLGSSNIGRYDYQPVINTFPQAVFGTDQHVDNGAIAVQLVNDDLRWETLTQTNVGFDAVFLDGKLSVASNYFYSETADILTPLNILMTTGNDGGNPYVNAASVSNTGFEVDMTWRNYLESSDLDYAVGLNFSTLRNKILSLADGETKYYTWQTINEVNQPISMYYLIRTDGIFQNQQEIAEHVNSQGVVIQPNAQPGDIRYLDYNDDGQITGDDRQLAGDPWADFELGLNFDVNYKNFDFGLQGFGAFGFDIFNGPKSVMDRFDDNSGYRAGISPWTPENTDTDFPRIVYADQRNSRGDTDRWLENGSYFRIRQISLGYTVPENIFKESIKKMRVSVTGRNLITFTKYSGLDPEFSAPNIFRRTHDDYMFPSVRNVSFNVQLSF